MLESAELLNLSHPAIKILLAGSVGYVLCINH